jgi:hypothetical protein
MFRSDHIQFPDFSDNLLPQIMNIGGAISPVAGFKLSAAPLPPERLALGNQLRSQFHSQEEQLQIHTNDSKVAGRTAARKMDTTSRSPSKQRSLSDGIKPRCHHPHPFGSLQRHQKMI